MYKHLELSSQLCFPFYAIYRKITQLYQPFLKELGITYPQYLIFLLLWQNDGLGIKEICAKLYLETNTVSPMLDILEKKGFLLRMKKPENKKDVYIYLTLLGKNLEEKAVGIPNKLISQFDFSPEFLENLHTNLYEVLHKITK